MEISQFLADMKYLILNSNLQLFHGKTPYAIFIYVNILHHRLTFVWPCPDCEESIAGVNRVVWFSHHSLPAEGTEKIEITKPEDEAAFDEIIDMMLVEAKEANTAQLVMADIHKAASPDAIFI
jgi:hypothetical protein